MERILTAEQMKIADRYTISTLGITEDVLVERAGTAVAEEIFNRFKGGRVLVCIGKGNNGADGQVVANLLSKRHGFKVDVLLVEDATLKLFDDKYDIILDCIFGTGLNREVCGIHKEIIKKINSSGAFVISCDVPSGLCSENGKVLGVAVKAKMTIAIQEYKTGYFLNDGPDYCGKIVVKDIGISVWEEKFLMRMTGEDVVSFFSKRERNVHKGNFGKVSVVGGSKNYPGSIYLSTLSLLAMKSGVGYVNLVVPKSMYGIYALKNPECTIMAMDDNNGCTTFDVKTLDSLMNYDTIAIGMGMGVSNSVYKSIEYILKNYAGILLIDADGLNCLSKYGVNILKNKNCQVVLTPHVGEFSRLSGLSKDLITSSPIVYAEEFAKKFSVVLVLKSATSIITNGDSTYLNTSGCSGMAKAGSGDVLSGFIAGVIARNKNNSLLDAVASACYVFGKAGEIAEKTNSSYTMTATDIINCLGKAINSI